MDIEQLIKTMTPELYQRLLYAVETGRWPEGESLSKAQKDQTIQLVMLYQSRFNQDEAHMSVARGGQLVIKSKQTLKQQFSPKGETLIYTRND